MNTQPPQEILKCSQCGIAEDAHRDLYGTTLGKLTFTFQPDHGKAFQGQVHLCRPCTHEVLTRRILHGAGIPDEVLVGETWRNT